MEPFRIRLNCIDHYQATASELDPPLPFRDGAKENDFRPKVPVIRVFGATETGQKICVHVHGAFPYLYIEYNGSLESDAVDSAIRTLHLSIDHALAISYRRNAYDKKIAYVAHITLVKGVPFYGYHVGYRTFFKIYLLNPFYITRLADLLHQGAVMKRPLQPYESHLQYVPQWMCDYNLYGCGYMDCRNVKFRAPVPEYLELSNLNHRWHDRSIDPERILDDPALQKQSHCSLEVDVCVQDILNRAEVKERQLHHDFVELLKPVAVNERLVPSVAGLWQDETKRRKKRMGITDPNGTPFGPEDLISMSADPRNQSKGGWVHEDEFRRLALQIAADEKAEDNGKSVSLETFLGHDHEKGDVKTALASVEDFYPDQIVHSALRPAQPVSRGPGDTSAHISVDENVALSSQMEQDYISDEEMSLLKSSEDGSASPQESGNHTTNGVDPGDSFYDRLFDEVPEHEITKIDRETGTRYESLESGQRTDNNRKLSESAISLVQHAGSTILKRSFTETIEASSPQKKPRFWTQINGQNGANGLANMGGGIETLGFLGHKNQDLECEPNCSSSSSSQRTIRPANKMPLLQNSRLNFPVVKDPNDPLTILRFSQEDAASSLKKTSNSQPPQLSQASGSRNSANQVIESDGSSQRSGALSTGGDKSQRIDPHVAELKHSIHDAFNLRRDSILCLPKLAGPSSNEVASTINDSGRPSMIYQQAFYSDENDVPDRPRQYAGREFRLESNTIHFLPDFNLSGNIPTFGDQHVSAYHDRESRETLDSNLRKSCSSRIWEFASVPPSRAEVIDWYNELEKSSCSVEATTGTSNKLRPKVSRSMEALSQIEGPTQQIPYGFKYSQKAKKTSVEHQSQYMSIMSLEVHVNTRGTLAANPEEDEISCVFWSLQSEDDDDVEVNSYLPGVHVGMIYQGDGDRPEDKVSKALSIEVEHEITELDLINRLIDIVRHHDPDIITGYEVHNGSWGYVIERARKKYDFDLCAELSRVKSQSKSRFGKEDDRWGFEHASSVQMTGRHMINIWRAMRGEITLLQYTMENVVFHLLQRRIPHYSAKDLTQWYMSGKPHNILKVVEYFTSRVQLNLEIIGANELVPRTSEQARLLGIDFYSVFARGSQFKVESLMFRIAKPENFLLVSPSRKQVGQQNALECLPLVMEPQSDFYTSPLLVLDFQSLYPSVMIAYNYCYSTFLGRAVQWRGRDKMGFLDYSRQPRILELLKEKINIAPNGMIYAKQEVRQSLLAKMLTEILETRIMVKTGMKADKDDKVLQKLLNNRQLALKLIANVTYGYTSASFSGRMPCSEIADSIVQSGRETLEKAIAFIHSVERWGAEVVYGDTDSLFVYLKGRTRDQAFDIGEEIAQAVTDMNPRPIKLKFEKVYHPCVLLAKKRYVGFKYEHRKQAEPEFDAKGIETVRRDGTPAEQKIEEKALKLLFRTSDLSQVKSYFQRQCSKIMQGRVSIQDFCFAREVRLGTYSDRGTLPAGAMISTKRMLEDPRLEPQYGERVPYVVVTGAPGSRLIDRCVAPETLLHDAQLDLDAEYYITKNLIPPLERIFNLVGANVRQWYDEMPKVQRMRRVDATSSASSRAHGENVIAKKTLESYMRSSSCMICRAKLTDAAIPLCSDCLQQPHLALLNVTAQLQGSEKRVNALQKVCQSCMGVPPGDTIACDSMDCPVFYSRIRATTGLRHTKAVMEPVKELLERAGEDDLTW